MNEKKMREMLKHRVFMDIVDSVAMCSTCIKKKVGAIIVKDGQILASGYNGVPSKIEHCTEETCWRKDLKDNQNPNLCKGVHAEINCIIQCALHGTKIGKGSCMYTRYFPCMSCLKAIINAGIEKVYYRRKYEMDNILKLELAKESNIKFYKIISNDMIRTIFEVKFLRVSEDKFNIVKRKI